VCGCSVEPYNPGKDRPWQVRVCPGYLVTPHEDEVIIAEAVNFDLAGDWCQAYDPCAQPSPCPPPGVRASDGKQIVLLAACYTECNTRPVRAHPVGCACDEAACEYSCIRDSFELVRLLELPEAHRLADEADKRWREDFRQWINDESKLPWPVPSCPRTPDDNCVVLARIELPNDRATEIAFGGVCH
jgi:hypothetical protein